MTRPLFSIMSLCLLAATLNRGEEPMPTDKCPEKSAKTDTPRIQISAGHDGSHITFTGPPGFGQWYLNFPEMFLLNGGPDQRGVALSVTKGQNGTVITSTSGGKYAKEFKITYTPKDDHIDMVMEVQNISKEKWQSGGEAMFCLSPRGGREFPRGLDVSRILVRYGNEYQTMSQMRDRFFNKELSQMVGFWVILEGVRSTKPGRVLLDNGLIVRRSSKGKRLVAVVWDQVDRVSMNLGFCTHSNPRINALAPAEKETRVGKIYFLEGDETDLWARYLADADYFSASLEAKED